MKGKRVIIIAGGSIGKREFFTNFFLTHDYIICADGGLEHARILGLKPDLIVGDMDSYHGDTTGFNCELLCFPQEKDKTDTELALEYSASLSPYEVIIIGGIGKRFDHSLGNIYLLIKSLNMGLRVTLLDSYQQIYLISRDLYIKSNITGETISLIPLTYEVTGIVTEGLRYPLNDECLYIGETRGISNKIISLPVFIRINSGLLLIIRNLIIPED